MRWVCLIFLIIFGVVVSIIQPLQAKDPSSSPQKTSACDSFGVQKIQVKKDAPAFTLKDLTGSEVTLKGYHGIPLLLFFWASWCSACKEDLVLLEKYFIKNKGRMEILTIAIDGERENRIKSIIKKEQITLPVLLDRKEMVARTYGVRMVPTAFLINGESMLQGIIVGQRDWCAPEAHLAIQELLGLR